MKKIAFILALAASVSFCADQLIIAAGGGYKKPVSAVIENLKKEGMDVAGSFANLGQLVIQSRENKISFIVGDEAFLKKSDLNITKFERIARRKFGKTPVPVDRDFLTKTLHVDPSEIITDCSIEDAKAESFADFEAELKKKGYLNPSEEDVLSYALFPQVAEEFFQAHFKKITAYVK